MLKLGIYNTKIHFYKTSPHKMNYLSDQSKHFYNKLLLLFITYNILEMF